MAYQVEGFDFEKHLDGLIDLAKTIKPNEVTLLTGPNGYGKSLIRKLIPAALEKGHNYVTKVASVSMERRTTPNENFSAFRSMGIDKADDATSNHTCDLVNSLFKEPDRYYVIDEPEIGMGKEILLGLLETIKTKVEEMKNAGTFKGLLIITHSEFVIDNLPHDAFVNLEGLTYEQWRDRPIKAISPKDLDVWCHKLWQTIQRRSEENKNK